jgi:hypothetical protein
LFASNPEAREAARDFALFATLAGGEGRLSGLALREIYELIFGRLHRREVVVLRGSNQWGTAGMRIQVGGFVTHRAVVYLRKWGKNRGDYCNSEAPGFR